MSRAAVTIPFAPALSKNRQHLVGRGQRVVKNPATKAAQDALALALRAQPGRWYPGRVDVAITVFKPKLAFDAANLVDAVLDAVKVGIGVDDQWFSCKADWAITKVDPRIEVVVTQEVEEAQGWCLKCGDIRPAYMFPVLRNDQGECLDCRGLRGR